MLIYFKITSLDQLFSKTKYKCHPSLILSNCHQPSSKWNDKLT